MAKKESTMRQHVRTSLVARIIYRIICIALLAIGVVGMIFTFSTGDKYHAYTKRSDKATAIVTKITRDVDSEYEYSTCAIEYEFEINGKKYTSQTSWESLPTNQKCNLHVGDTIKIRYQEAQPENNAYGDNRLSKDLNLTATIIIAIGSILPLGFGFIGLLAIHKAMQQEDNIEDGTLPATDEQMRLIRKGYKELGQYWSPTRNHITRNAANEILRDLEVQMNQREESKADGKKEDKDS